MAENQTMAQLLQAPTEGYKDAILIPKISATNFELKHGLINLVQNKQFFGHDKEDPHTHLRYFNKITSMMRQIFDESFSEAWDHFNDLLRACPHHGFSELHQLDTFYNALNVNDQDLLNSAAGGNFLDKLPSDCLKIIESKSKDMVRALLLDKKNQYSAPAPTPSPTPSPIKAVEPNCVTCGGTHAYQNCPATSGNVYQDNIQEYVSQVVAANYGQGNTGFRLQMVANQIRPPGHNTQNNFNRGNNFNQNGGSNFKQSNFNQNQLHRPQVNQTLAYQAPAYQAPVSQTQSVSQTDFERYIKANDAVLRNIQSQGQSTQNHCQTMQNQFQTMQNQLANLTDMMSKFMSSNTASSSGSGTHLGPITPTPSKVTKQGTEVTKDQVQTLNSQSTAPVQPTVAQSRSETPISEPVVAPVSTPMPNLKLSIPYPSRLDNERRRDQANEIIKKFYEIFKDMSFKISFTDALMLMPKFASTLKALIGNKEKLNQIESKPISIAKDVKVKVGVFHFPADFVVVDFEPDPRVPLIIRRCFLKTGRALIDVHKGELTLRIENKAFTYNLDQTSRYSANYDQMTTNKIDVTDEACKEYSQEVLGFSDVTASGSLTPSDDLIVSTTSPTLTQFGDSDFLLFEEADAFLGLKDDPDSPELDPSYYDLVGDILLLEAILNTKTIKSSIDEPPKVELKDLPPHLEYAFLEGDNKLPIIIAKELGDEKKSALIKPGTLCSEKGGFTVATNAKNELIQTRLITGWRVCIGYRKLNESTRKDHFPRPFMDQMLERLAGNEYYCFLDGFSGYFQIPINPCDQEKTTLTCPYGTFAYRHMPFGLCNAPSTFKRCMLAIFYDMVEKTMEVFMDHFLVFGNSFENCLSRFDKMLQRCEDTKLCLNWEKSHFMVKEGIVLGRKISKNRTEVDKAKIDVITKLPHPTTVKGDTPFIFSEDCIKAFQTLNKKLTEAPILIAPKWDLPFELRCDASNFAIGAVLGQRLEKNFRPIHYASKTLTDTESNYTTTKTEMLAVVYAFEKFRSYLTMHKCIVHTDHSALKYLFAKKDAKAYWALKQTKFDLSVAGDHQKIQLNEHNELRDHAYENSLIYKEKTKRIHDSKFKNRVFNVSDQVLLFNS
nr:reverse transcriptase domain-containing protein [Tanacetum cinerariifolium]